MLDHLAIQCADVAASASLRVEPWVMRELAVVDPAGNGIRVGTNI